MLGNPSINSSDRPELPRRKDNGRVRRDTGFGRSGQKQQRAARKPGLFCLRRQYALGVEKMKRTARIAIVGLGLCVAAAPQTAEASKTAPATHVTKDQIQEFIAKLPRGRIPGADLFGVSAACNSARGCRNCRFTAVKLSSKS
jgi:hypothetical protein